MNYFIYTSQSNLDKNKNSACLKKSTVCPMFQSPQHVYGRPLIIACLFRLWLLWRQRSVVDIKRHKYSKSNLFYKQTHCMRAVIDTKGRQTNTLHDRIDTNWNSINKPVISCSLSIRRFWGKGERWKRKRERAEGEKRLTLMLLLEPSTPTQHDSIWSNQNHFRS